MYVNDLSLEVQFIIGIIFKPIRPGNNITKYASQLRLVFMFEQSRRNNILRTFDYNILIELI